MREIKFRAWDKKHKKMLEGYKHPYGHSGLWLNIETGNLTHIQRGEEGVECSIYEFKDVLLMQYTGLKDKNGVEIYEGDIIGYPNQSFKSIVRFGSYLFTGGEYGESGIGFYLEMYNKGIKKSMEGGIFNHPSVKDVVIGNIYENPELLVKEENA